MPSRREALNTRGQYADGCVVNRRQQNEAKIYGLRRTMPFPASILIVDGLLVAADRPSGARLGVAAAIAVVTATWLIGSWISVRFTVAHLDDTDEFWQAQITWSRRVSRRVAGAIATAALGIEVVALGRSAWLLATATLGPLVTALVVLAGLADSRHRRCV